MARRAMIRDNGVSTIILAAGSADRLGGGGKAFLMAAGSSYLAHAIALFGKVSDQIIVTLHPDDIDYLRAADYFPDCQFVQGGQTRQASFENAFEKVSGSIVLLQDVARPLTSMALVQKLLRAARDHDAVTPVVPVKSRDSLSYVIDGFIAAPAARDNLVSLQTPQAYRRDMLAQVLEQAKQHFWEEASVVPLVRRAGVKVKIIEGEAGNIKVTYPEDIEAVAAKLSEREHHSGQ